MTSFEIDRRNLLRATGGSALGATVLQTSAAQSSGGDLRWKFWVGDNVRSSPTVLDETVYIGGGDGNLYALDAVTGREQWQYEADGGIYSSPSVVDGTVYFSALGNLYAVDAATGEEEWKRTNLVDESSGVTVAGDTVYLVGHGSGELYARDTDTGGYNWRVTFDTDPTPQANPPTVVDQVYFGWGYGTANGGVSAIDTTTGDVNWTYFTGESVYSAPTVVDGTVYFGCRDEYLYAVDADTGNKVWSEYLYNEIESSPTVYDGKVYIGARAPYDEASVLAVDAASGELDWWVPTEGQVRSSPTAAGGRVFIGDDDGYVYALDAENGYKEWTFDTGNPYWVWSSPTVVDGIVFVGTYDEYVYAIDAGIEGSSVGSRVNLGTLGHHHVWAGEEPSEIPDPGSLTGTVTAPDGTAVSDLITLFLVTPDQLHVAIDLVEQYPVEVSEVDDALDSEGVGAAFDDGTYVIEPLNPGQYFLLAIPPTDSEYGPAYTSGIIIEEDGEHTQDIALTTRPLGTLDPVANQVFENSEAILFDSSVTAGTTFLDGVDVLADELIDTFDVVDFALGYDIEGIPEEFETDLEKQVAEAGIDVAEYGLDRVLEAIWAAMDPVLQDAVNGVSSELAQTEWFRTFGYDNLDELVTAGYTETPLYQDATSTIDGARADYNAITSNDPSDEFSLGAAEDVLEEVAAQLANRRYGVPGVVITPGGATYQFDQAETYAESYEWTKDRLGEIGDAKTLSQVAKVAGGVLILTGKGAPVGAYLFSAGAKSYKALELAEALAKTKLAVEWGLTQIYWGVDLDEASKASRATVDWLDAAVETGLTDASVSIESVDLSLVESYIPGVLPYVQANRPEKAPGWFPASIQTVAVENATVTVQNESDESVEVRVTMYDQYGGGENVSNEGTMVPPADEPGALLAPGETRTFEAEYAADFNGILTGHTMAVDVWVDGVRRASTVEVFQVRPGVVIGSETADLAADRGEQPLRSPALVATMDDKEGDEPLTVADLEDIRRRTTTVLSDTVTPGDTVRETTHTTGDTTTEVEFVLAGGRNVALQVVDADGNVTGYDPEIDEQRMEIPDASYRGPAETLQRVTIATTPGTTYTVRAVGYRFPTDTEADVEVRAIEMPERDAVMSVSPGQAQVCLAPGTSGTVELGIAEAGEQEPLNGLTLEPGEFADPGGNTLNDVTFVWDSPYTIGPGGEQRIPVTLEAGGSISPPGAPDVTRFDGSITVETTNAGSLDVAVSVLVLDTDLTGVNLRGASPSIDGVALTSRSLENIQPDPPDDVEPVAAYDLDVTGEGTVRLTLPRPEVAGVFGYVVGDEWTQLDTGRTSDSVWVSVDSAGPTSPVVVGVRDFGPPPLPGFENPPQDLDNDGRYEDVNGDGSFDVFDVQALFDNLDSDVVQNNPDAFDFSGDGGSVTIFDVQALFNRLDS